MFALTFDLKQCYKYLFMRIRNIKMNKKIFKRCYPLLILICLLSIASYTSYSKIIPNVDWALPISDTFDAVIGLDIQAIDDIYRKSSDKNIKSIYSFLKILDIDIKRDLKYALIGLDFDSADELQKRLIVVIGDFNSTKKNKIYSTMKNLSKGQTTVESVKDVDILMSVHSNTAVAIYENYLLFGTFFDVQMGINNILNKNNAHTIIASDNIRTGIKNLSHYMVWISMLVPEKLKQHFNEPEPITVLKRLEALYAGFNINGNVEFKVLFKFPMPEYSIQFKAVLKTLIDEFFMQFQEKALAYKIDLLSINDKIKISLLEQLYTQFDIKLSKTDFENMQEPLLDLLISNLSN